MTNSISEIKHNDTIFVIGSNTTETHPVIGAFIKQAVKSGAKLIVADPREIELTKFADVHLQLKPGTNIALINGMMNVIIENKLYDEEYIRKNCENFDELVRLVKNYPPKRSAEICGVDEDLIIKAALIYANSPNAGIYYTMGVTQHTTGTHAVMSLSNLALLCGNIGKENAGINPLRGQNNVQGASDMGATPAELTGYQKIFHKESLEKFERAWGTKLSDKVGATITEMFNLIEEDEIKFLYIMGENPVVSDPDTNHVISALKKVDFLVVQDIFFTETCEYADLVLPAVSFAQKDGTFTNTERRVQRVRKAVKENGLAKPDWQIIMEIMNTLGYHKKYSNPQEIMEEISSLTPQYSGITYEKIDDNGIQWPCKDKDDMGTKFLHKDKISRGKGLFMPVEYVKSRETPDENYPFILTTGRILYHYHTRTMTGREEGLNDIVNSSYIEINEETANRMNIENGDKVRVKSRRGEIITRAKVVDTIDRDVVFMPFHFTDGQANYLTNTFVDEIAKIPELKVSAVSIEKLNKEEDYV
jgi:formate dehydrogenase major subunit